MIYLGSGLTEEESAPYLEALGTPEALGAALNWYRAAGGHLIEGLGPITVPTLHVWSTADPALGREGAEATGDHVEGPYRLEVLEGVDHWIPEHAPDRLNELLLEHVAQA
jgi:pimeloyl-ACP methyl ester carboxylesterase